MISIEDPGRFSRVSDKQNNINGHTILSLRFYVSNIILFLNTSICICKV